MLKCLHNNKFVALLIALIYQGQSLDAQSAVNVQGVIFLLITNSTFENVFAVINVNLCQE